MPSQIVNIPVQHASLTRAQLLTAAASNQLVSRMWYVVSDEEVAVIALTPSTFIEQQVSLGFTPENAANKGAANGYAPLVAGLVPSIYIPATIGAATIDFGAGSNSASVTVTGQTAITAGALPIAVFDGGGSNAKHNAAAHQFIASIAALTTSDVVAGDRFTIRAYSAQKLTGQFQLRWKY